MKAGWPDEPAKYARAAGFAFVFLLFINACIYLVFGPRVGREEGKAESLVWDKLEGWCAACPRSQRLGGVVCLFGWLFFLIFILFCYILFFKPPLGVAPYPAPSPAFTPAKGLLLLAAASQPRATAPGSPVPQWALNTRFGLVLQ